MLGQLSVTKHPNYPTIPTYVATEYPHHHWSTTSRHSKKKRISKPPLLRLGERVTAKRATRPDLRVHWTEQTEEEDFRK